MPVIVAPDAFDFWLDCRKVEAETAAALIVPAPDDLLEAYRVSSAVNHVDNDTADLIAPFTGEPEVPARPADDKQATGTKKTNDQLSLF
jgi:putative SOS response-associated peptidase YedK